MSLPDAAPKLNDSTVIAPSISTNSDDKFWKDAYMAITDQQPSNIRPTFSSLGGASFIFDSITNDLIDRSVAQDQFGENMARHQEQLRHEQRVASHDHHSRHSHRGDHSNGPEDQARNHINFSPDIFASSTFRDVTAHDGQQNVLDGQHHSELHRPGHATTTPVDATSHRTSNDALSPVLDSASNLTRDLFAGDTESALRDLGNMLQDLQRMMRRSEPADSKPIEAPRNHRPVIINPDDECDKGA